MSATDDRLRHLALRAEADPLACDRLLTRPLGLVRAVRGWTHAELSDWLGCPGPGYWRLLLCGVPRDRAECELVTGRFGGAAGRLAEALGL
jgi:hypothetical protein